MSCSVKSFDWAVFSQSAMTVSSRTQATAGQGSIAGRGFTHAGLWLDNHTRTPAAEREHTFNPTLSYIPFFSQCDSMFHFAKCTLFHFKEEKKAYLKKRNRFGFLIKASWLPILTIWYSDHGSHQPFWKRQRKTLKPWTSSNQPPDQKQQSSVHH